jgi:dihydrofolate synthase/folylpolyglutamate synthase
MKFETFLQLEDELQLKQQNRGIDLGLERMENACKELGNPEKNLKVIHYAGSNGKGSTLNYNKEILIAQGYSVGSFTSPAQNKVNDQILINRTMISDDEFLLISNEMVSKLSAPDEITEFEWITLVAFQYFAKNNPDFILIEAGLGGRLDSTNVVDPLISVITSISMEHAQFLGNSLEEIALEKAGIIKFEKPAVVGKVETGVLEVIVTKAMEQKSDLFSFYSRFSIDVDYFNEDGEIFNFYKDLDIIHEDLFIQMNGIHQVENAATAIMVCEILKDKYNVIILDEAVRKGLSKCNWPGRFETLSKEPLIILDGAHNSDGVRVLLETLRRKYSERSVRFIFSCFKDKDELDMISQIEGIADEIIFTEMMHERSAKSEDLFKLSVCPRKSIERHISKKFLEDSSKEMITICTGSLQLVKEIREEFQMK